MCRECTAEHRRLGLRDPISQKETMTQPNVREMIEQLKQQVTPDVVANIQRVALKILDAVPNNVQLGTATAGIMLAAVAFAESAPHARKLIWSEGRESHGGNHSAGAGRSNDASVQGEDGKSAVTEQREGVGDEDVQA